MKVHDPIRVMARAAVTLADITDLLVARLAGERILSDADAKIVLEQSIEVRKLCLPFALTDEEMFRGESS